MHNKKYLNLIDSSYLEFIKISNKIQKNKFKIEDLENIKNKINLVNKKLKKHNFFDLKVGGVLTQNDANISNNYNIMISDINMFNQQLYLLNGHIKSFFEKILLIFSFIGNSLNSNGGNQGKQTIDAFIQPIEVYIKNYLSSTSAITGVDLKLNESATSSGPVSTLKSLPKLKDETVSNDKSLSDLTKQNNKKQASKVYSSIEQKVKTNNQNVSIGGYLSTDSTSNGLLSLLSGFLTDIISIIGSILILFNTLSTINNNLIIYINKFNYITPNSIKLYSEAMKSITPILTTLPKSVPGISVGNLEQLKKNI